MSLSNCVICWFFCLTDSVKSLNLSAIDKLSSIGWSSNWRPVISSWTASSSRRRKSLSFSTFDNCARIYIILTLKLTYKYNNAGNFMTLSSSLTLKSTSCFCSWISDDKRSFSSSSLVISFRINSVSNFII